jgi:hypothetical protein
MVRRATALALAALLASAAAPAAAQDGAHDARNPTCPPLASMQFADLNKMLFRLDTSSGKRVLIADGKINPFASTLLEQAIKANLPLDELWIRSPGGYAEEGMRLGAVIRNYGLPTRIPAGWWCASACTFMFLGGPIRTIEPDGVYAVHMFSEVTAQAFRPELDQAYRPGGMDQVLNDIAKVEQNSALTASRENDFIIRMGASRKLLSEAMYRQKSTAFGGATDLSTIRCLQADELKRYNVVNAAP